MGVYELPKREKDMHTSYLWANLPLILQMPKKRFLLFQEFQHDGF